MLSYPAAIPLSTRSLNHLAGRHRVQRGSRWRRLDPGRQALLAATADDLTTARNRIRQLAYAILDGSLIPIDRVADQKPYYSGKHRRHGVNVRVVADPAGRLVWAPAALPGSAHDLTAARAHGIIEALSGPNVMTFADQAYQGARGGVRTPFKRHRHRPKLSRWQRNVNRAHARIRAIGERANAHPRDLESPDRELKINSGFEARNRLVFTSATTASCRPT